MEERGPRRHGGFSSSASPTLPSVQPLLEPLDATDEVMLKIVAKLNQRKYRASDFFRTIDLSCDGIVSVEEFRAGLAKMSLKPTQEEFDAVVRRLDLDGSGDINFVEFDRAVKLVAKKAKAEGRSAELETFGYARPTTAALPSLFDWSQRSLFTTTSASLASPAPGEPGGPKLPTPWSVASAGPRAKAFASLVGSGSVFDGSIQRDRPLDALASPGAVRQQPWLPRQAESRPLNGGVHHGRFGREPGPVPSAKLLTTMRFCSTATRGTKMTEPAATGGVRTYHNSPMMQSTVDQVVFNRDIDMSGDTKLDEEFTCLYEGMAGIPSWHYGGR